MTQKAVALLAEDEPVLRMVAADMLADIGFEVIEAGTALEALSELEANSGMVLLMTDVQMPGEMDGFALAREVAQRWPAMAILVCSGRMNPEPGDLPSKAKFIGKPFNPDTITVALQQLQLV